jgi:hypothetical protein
MSFSQYSRVSRIAATLALLSASSMLAQTVTGSITGTVSDQTGAVIPGAMVTVTNTQTGVASNATTNGAGVYTVRFLPIGQYKVDIAANGFTGFTQPAFALEIDQTAKVDARMSVGASTEVSVQGNLAPILDTTDGTLGLSMNSKQIETIPLNGRNFSSLTLFQPGAVNTDPTGLTGSNAIERTTYNNGIVTINGNRAQANNYTLDGIDLNEGQNNLIGYNPAPDAIGEIKVVSANAPANYGNVNGGDVISVLKSGTDSFHGSVYGYLENANLDANTWANNFAGNKINPFTQTIFGGTLGGPIIKKKLFFFADYEGVRNHHGGTGTASVLTAAMRGGDFSALEGLLDSTGAPAPTQLYNTQVPVAANGTYTPVPYTNDQGVPIVNPVVKYLIANPQYYPLPNKAPTDQLVQNNFIGPTKAFTDNDQGDIKIEADPRAQDKITAFYSQSDAEDQTTPVLAISFTGPNSYPSKLGGGTWVYTFSPNVVNEARVGFTRVRWDNSIPADQTGNFGLKGDSVVGIPFGAQQYVGFSYQGVSNNLSGVGTPAEPQILRDNTFSYQDNLTIQRGKHLLSMGVQVLRYQENYSLSGNGGQLGSFSFSGAFTGINNGNGYGPADWVSDLSSAQSISISSGLFGERQYRSAGFLQDDWKATDKLTVNLGIRYEFDQPWTEAHNKTANVLLSGPLAGTVEYAGSVPANAPAGSIVCDRPSCYQPNYKQIMPRVGFAYQVNPRFVVRGGYGTTSFFEGDAGNQRLSYNPPFVDFTQLSATSPVTNAGTPYKVENGFQLGGVSAPGYGAWPQNIQPAYLQEFNLTTEYQLSNAMSLQLGYVGELGAHLADYRNANQLTAAQAASIAALPMGAPIPAGDVAPFFNLVGQSNALLLTESEAMSNYHAAQVTVRHRETNGFEYTVNYTYSRSMTNSDGNYGGSNVAGPGGLQNGYNLGGDYGPSDQDVRNNLSAVGTYAVPFGRGKQFGSDSNRIVDLLAGGWSISGTAIAYSGLPITIFSPGNNSNTNSYNSRSNQYRKLKVVNRGVGNWFGTDPTATPCPSGVDNGTCAYGPETANTFGTAAVGTERAPGYEQIDTSAFKDFHITDSQALGFRADAFNVFNFASYGNPDNTVGDSTFGQITSTRSGPRIIQLGAHYTF